MTRTPTTTGKVFTQHDEERIHRAAAKRERKANLHRAQG